MNGLFDAHRVMSSIDWAKSGESSPEKQAGKSVIRAALDAAALWVTERTQAVGRTILGLSSGFVPLEASLGSEGAANEALQVLMSHQSLGACKLELHSTG